MRCTMFTNVEHMDMIENKLRSLFRVYYRTFYSCNYLYIHATRWDFRRMKEYQHRVKPGVAGISSLPGESILLVLDIRRFHDRLRDDLRK